MKTTALVRIALAMTLVLLAASLAACAASGSPGAGTGGSLAGRKYIAVAYRDGSGFATTSADSTITAVFGADGRVTGNATINDYQADYRVAGSSITVSNVVVLTHKSGDAAQMAQETAYLAALSQSVGWRALGDALEIANGDSIRVVSFRER